MSARRRTLVPIFVLGLLASVAAMAGDHTWANYHWARDGTSSFTLKTIDSTTSEWDVAFNGSIDKWSFADSVDLAIDSVQENKRARRRCKMVQGQMRVCNAAYGNNGWLGMATIGLDPNGHIDRGTAKMNDTYASYWNIFGERNHVACQEIGHVLGVNHTSVNGSSQGTCMDYSSDPASQWPNQADLDLLDFVIYAHLDTYNSYDNGSSNDGGGCNAPPGKGCNKNRVGARPPMGVRVHHSDREEVWVAPRRDGGLWIHHVILAP